MKKLKKNNIVNFPSSLSDGEKEVEAILFAAAEPLDIDTKGKYEAEVPAMGVFSLLSAKIETVPEYYLSLNFSDPVDKRQTLDGLISIDGMSDLRFVVVKNEVKVYFSNEFDLNKKVKISEGLRNTYGKKLTWLVEMILQSLFLWSCHK